MWQSGWPFGQVLHDAPRENHGRWQPTDIVAITATSTSITNFFMIDISSFTLPCHVALAAGQKTLTHTS